MMRKGLLLVLLFLYAVGATAQIGGNGIYKFMNLPPSSRTSALGGNLISVKDDDVTLAIQNAALLNPSMNNHLALSYIDYMADIGFGSAVYARYLDSLHVTAMGGIQYIQYGTFTKADEQGNKLGTFTAGEYNIFTGFGKEWKKLSYGGQLKFIYSSLESYSSYGMAVDIAGAYEDTARGLSVGTVIKNVGLQFKSYAGTRENLPIELQAGVAIKPKHMPVRFSMVLHNLERWDLSYIDTNKSQQTDLATGQPIVEKISFGDKMARHAIFGAELILSRNFMIRFGYNYQRRKEMSIPNNRGFVGFSYGFGFRVSKFHISYGRSSYSLAGASNTFTITTNFSEIFTRSKK